jgi:dTDP-glucose 4,6-dehydratase
LQLGIANLLKSDLDETVQYLLTRREFFEGKEVLIFGGTGFVGTWLTSTLLSANDEHNFNMNIKIVTRDSYKASLRFGVSGKSVEYIEQDLSQGEPRIAPRADIVFLGSTPTRNSTGSNDNRIMLEAALNAANFAVKVRSLNFNKPQVVHLSSGAVYGKQPLGMSLRSELDPVFENASDPYVMSKILIDNIISLGLEANAIDFYSPRLFAFAGPLISLGEHFAVGNFMGDGMNRRAIRINGHPETLRSYMYPTDLIRCLLALVGSGLKLPVNIGSDFPIKMINLARQINKLTYDCGIEALNLSSAQSNYVPSIDNQKKYLQTRGLISLEESISRWKKWIKLSDHPTSPA